MLSRELSKKRFVDKDFANKSATLVKNINKILSIDEAEKIRLFCERMKLDYCELDVLRDKNNGRIYIVDANSTPAGPPGFFG